MKRNYVVPVYRLLISIDYKYDMQKVISFITTYDVGITKAYIHYLYKYPEPFDSIGILPVGCNLSVSKFFESVNEI